MGPGASGKLMKAHLSTSMKALAPDHGGGAKVTRAPRTSRFSRTLVAGVALGAAALGLAACGSPGAGVVHVTSPAVSWTAPSPSAVAGGRYTTIVEMSGLQVSPPATSTSSEHLGLTWSQAAVLFAATSAVQGSHAQAILGYGLVTVSGSTLPAGTPPLDRRAAWVGITWGGITSCPAATVPERGSSSSTASYRQIFTAVVIYGQGGAGAIVYRSRGTPPCGGPMTGPSTTAAREVVSVPWQHTTSLYDGSVRVSYQAPSCATLFSTAASGKIGTDKLTLVVELTVPFDHASCRTTTDTTSIRLFPSPRTPGAPAVSSHPTLAHGPTGSVAVLEAGRIAGGSSSPGARASSGISRSAARVSTGILRGVVRLVGGPAPGSSRPVPARITIRRSGHVPVEVRTAADGAFGVTLPTGIYEVTARSVRYYGSAALCDPHARSTVRVQPATTTDIQVDCEAR